jgi:hypothetical protein
MAKVDYFLLAENCILDTAGRLSIINIFDSVNSLEPVAIPPKFTFVIGITPAKSDIKDNLLRFRAEIKKPDGETLLDANGGGEIPDDKIGNRVLSPLDLSGKLQFDQEGTHTATLFINNKKKAQNDS